MQLFHSVQIPVMRHKISHCCGLVSSIRAVSVVNKCYFNGSTKKALRVKVLLNQEL